ncbi:MAG: ferrous iron transport protein B [Ruminococcus sp.]|nr:ferrous iron transport protein B [Ruminococcus sp.]
MIFALAGNQNCGKTTLFNQLTGSNQHVGNFPGVTIEEKVGEVKGHSDCSVVDLPGIYSIRPYTGEETVTRDFLISGNADGIINIVDAANIERNLYLTLQMLELKIPMILALNMMDEVRNNGGTVDIQKLSEKIGIPVIPISAVKNEGVDELITCAIETAKRRQRPKNTDYCNGAVHRCIHAVCHIIEDHAANAGLERRFCATKLIEGDPEVTKRLALNQNELDMIEHSVTEMETELDMDRNAAIADMRYSFIEKVCAETVVKCRESKEHIRSVKIDGVLTHKYLAIPVFILIMALIFWMTFGVIGSFLSDILSNIINAFTAAADSALCSYGLNPIIRSLVIDGVFAGVGSVLSFLPTIVTLFFFLSILEDSGYMARVAFVMDKLLRKIGLSGRSFVPMIIGFGCSVPAIMAARTLASERDRQMTIFLTPFMSCSAKLPIYSVFAMAFFPDRSALVMCLLYFFGIICAAVYGFILSKTKFSGNPVPFVMELPNYRLPSLKSVLLLMWDKAKDFLTRAFTVIFAASVIIWFLQSFDLRLNPVADSSLSMLADIGHVIAPLFAPLGFGDWRAATALITGFTAKEAVISTLSVLMGASSADLLPPLLQASFSPLSAVSFLIFSLLYTPCAAAVATVKKEMNSSFAAVMFVLVQCAAAWLAAFAVYRLGALILL